MHKNAKNTSKKGVWHFTSPVMCGSIRAMQNVDATAASTALPPSARTSSPIWKKKKIKLARFIIHQIINKSTSVFTLEQKWSTKLVRYI